MTRFRLLLLLVPLLLGGCLAKATADIVTAPVKLVSGAADLATTSQSEADEKRGRALRQQEQELGRLERRYESQLDRCNKGNRRACSDAQTTYAELQTLLRTIPAGPLPEG
ncbi:MAG: hypothetical protein ACK4GD_06240 [Sphingomonadaceae bacterium]